MKIGFIEPHLKIVGGIRRILEVTTRLKKFGHDVTIYTPSGEAQTWFDTTVSVKRLSKIHDISHDVVVFNLAEQYNICLQAKAKKKIFWVLAPEAYYKTVTIPVTALNQNFYLLCNSSYTRDYIKKYVTVPYEIPIIPGGVNPLHFRYDPTIQKNYHVLYYGSRRPWKGATLIKSAMQNTNLNVICMEGLKTKQVDMYKLYNSSVLYVSAGLAEGFSMPPLEAMACGCVVICTNEGGNMDYIKNGWNCILSTRDPNSIKRHVMNTLKDPKLIQTLRYNGLLTAKQSKFNWDNITKKFLSAVENF